MCVEGGAPEWTAFGEDAQVFRGTEAAMVREFWGVIERESLIRLSQKDAHKVLTLLDTPPKPNKRLKDAVKAFKATVRA